VETDVAAVELEMDMAAFGQVVSGNIEPGEVFG
jgi:hypothetical protein